MDGNQSVTATEQTQQVRDNIKHRQITAVSKEKMPAHKQSITANHNDRPQRYLNWLDY